METLQLIIAMFDLILLVFLCRHFRMCLRYITMTVTRVILTCVYKLSSSAHLLLSLTVVAWSPVSIQTQSLALCALRKRKPQETQALASRNKRKRQPIGMLGRSSGNNDWLLANASAHVSCGFRLRNARNASDCVWMETGLEYSDHISVWVCVRTIKPKRLKLAHI